MQNPLAPHSCATQRIAAEDRSIDEFVCRLYGLSEDEVGVVEVERARLFDTLICDCKIMRID